MCAPASWADEVIRPFALAMAIGVLIGTYSSIFIAAPTLLWLETRYGEKEAPGQAKPKAKPEAAEGDRPGKGGGGAGRAGNPKGRRRKRAGF